MVGGAARGDCGLLELTQARGGLASVQDPGGRGVTSATAATQRAASVATPDRRCRKFRAVRSAVSRAAAWPRTAITSPRSRQTPSAVSRSHRTSGSSTAEGALDDRQPEHDPRRLLNDQSLSLALRGHRRRGGHIPGADVLGQCPPYDRVDARPQSFLEHRQPFAWSVTISSHIGWQAGYDAAASPYHEGDLMHHTVRDRRHRRARGSRAGRAGARRPPPPPPSTPDLRRSETADRQARRDEHWQVSARRQRVLQPAHDYPRRRQGLVPAPWLSHH